MDAGSMDRRRKVELFEEIRREYQFRAGTIQGVAKRLKTHRRMVRQVRTNRYSVPLWVGSKM
jgi:hypothetical protein